MYLDNDELQATDNYTYLGNKVYKDGGADVDIKNPMNKTRGAFFRLKSVWRSTIYSRRTKLRLYQSCVLSTLFYCWRMTKLDIRHLSTSLRKCLQNIMKIFWPQKNLKKPIAKNNRTKQYEQQTRHKKMEMDQPCPEKGGRQHLKDCTKMDT